MRTHVQVLGWIMVAMHGLALLVGAFLLLGMLGIGGLVASSGGGMASLGIFAGVGTVLLLVCAIIALPGLMAGIGLLQRATWGRILAIVMCILGLLEFPVGTALGIYGLIVLFNEETVRSFQD